MNRVRVCVPGTSANLGPGFDCFGMAWALYQELEFAPSDRLEITGCPTAYQNENNLAYQAFCRTLEFAGILPPKGLRISFLRSEIPISRGLGSSASLICGGIAGADAMYGLGLTGDQKLSLAAGMEGHPDNAAPALFGGFTACAMLECGPALTVYAVSERLHFAALIPDFELSTRLARAALPEQVPLRDAVFNVSRAALLPKAMETGDLPLLKQVLADRLHQPYRFPLIPGSARAIALAQGQGAAVCISGAGPTLLCIGESEALSGMLREALAAELSGWRVIELLPDRTGTVQQL